MAKECTGRRNGKKRQVRAPNARSNLVNPDLVHKHGQDHDCHRDLENRTDLLALLEHGSRDYSTSLRESRLNSPTGIRRESGQPIWLPSVAQFLHQLTTDRLQLSRVARAPLSPPGERIGSGFIDTRLEQL